MSAEPPVPSNRTLLGLPRAVEMPLALLGLAVVSPLLVVCALLIKLTSHGPVLFRQVRVGRAGREFCLLKLRSMREQTPSVEHPQITATGDPRVTAFGRLLRRTKLDELPELWNVVRGDMSLVGPRPEVPRYVDLDHPLWQTILRSRPGLTDPATLELRDEEAVLALLPGDRTEAYRRLLQPFKLRRSAAYLETRSAWSDLRLLAQTALALVLPPTAAPDTVRRILDDEAETESKVVRRAAGEPGRSPPR